MSSTKTISTLPSHEADDKLNLICTKISGTANRRLLVTLSTNTDDLYTISIHTFSHHRLCSQLMAGSTIGLFVADDAAADESTATGTPTTAGSPTTTTTADGPVSRGSTLRTSLRAHVNTGYTIKPNKIQAPVMAAIFQSEMRGMTVVNPQKANGIMINTIRNTLLRGIL